MLYDVPLIPQSRTMSCWAASMAMILAWKRHSSIADDAIQLHVGGTNYLPQLQAGLSPNDVHVLQANGFKVVPTSCLDQTTIDQLLIGYGPLWFASAVPTPHVRVICGLSGGRLTLNDPSPVGVGSRYTETFSQGFGALETLGASEAHEHSPVYLAHLQAATKMQSQ